MASKILPFVGNVCLTRIRIYLELFLLSSVRMYACVLNCVCGCDHVVVGTCACLARSEDNLKCLFFFQEPFSLLFESRHLIALALAYMAGLAGKQPPIPTSRAAGIHLSLYI